MVNYEYKTLISEYSNKDEVDKILNEYGMDGWEILNIDIKPPTIDYKKWKLNCVFKKNVTYRELLNG